VNIERRVIERWAGKEKYSAVGVDRRDIVG
jgi:hypothetical protein